ncbi:MAG: type I phosphomannose isomerase catalytic subunit, partial [Verrucomicrobiota bacterium]
VDRPEAQSVVSAGRFAGKSLGELWNEHGEEVFGAAVEKRDRFPLLMKILDAADVLSIQVHPPNPIAGQLGGESKTEMWYIAAAEPGAKLYIGLREGVDADQFRDAIENGSVEETLNVLEPKAGDFIFIPSGRLHAIGAGLLIYEIQENSDTTYRVYDWNRLGLDAKPRQLHVEEALQSINFADPEPQLGVAEGTVLVDCDEFTVQRMEVPPGESKTIAGEGEFAIVTVVQGAIQCGQFRFTPGQFFAIPAAANGGCDIAASSRAQMLVTTLPS